MTKARLLTVFIVLLLVSCSQTSKSPFYKDKNASVEDRVNDLLKRMTLEEKILQLNQGTVGRNTNINNIGGKNSLQPGSGSYINSSYNPALHNQFQKKSIEDSRLGIPVIFGYDVIHGFRTVYPISLAQACSWNPGLVTRACAMAAKEAKLSGVDWTFSPMIDVARDPRWGRVAEGYGEDPYTNAVFGAASVKGYQGKSLSDPYSIAACLKHYVGYGRSEGGRDYHYADISAQSLWETYLVPYEAGVKAGAATVMSAFNDISGVPASANHYTLTEILKQKWGFDGFVVSDWDAVKQLINQGVAKDDKEATLKALMAGVDMDMVDDLYKENLKQLVEDKKVPIERINDAVKRILRIKFRLGLFEHPYVSVSDTANRFLLPEYKDIAEKLAQESMVLLKNKDNVLPLSGKIKRVALIGPIAKDKSDLLGSWSAHGNPNDVVSVFEGLEKEFGKKLAINYAKGCNLEGEDESGFKDAITAARKSDVILLCLGESRRWSGENASRSTIALPVIQEKLARALQKTGKPIVLILSNGRPIGLARLEPLADAIVEIWQPGIEGGNALAGILSGRTNPSGKLAITFPLTTGQIPTYYDMRQSSRPLLGKYQDIPTEPLYWFGHGLSYTTFSYGKVKLSASSIKKNQKITAEVEVSNTGSKAGKETVLWFISDPACSISRPMKELKYFEKKEINPGEKTVFKFEIDPKRDLGYVDPTGRKFLESGDYYLIVGNQKIKFEVVD